MAIKKAANGIVIKPRPGAGLQTFAKPKITKAAAGLPTGDLGDVIAAINKKSPNVIRMASHGGLSYGRLRSGIFILDLALGGGWCLSKASMVFGEKSTGKTTLALMTIARAQKAFPHMYAAWMDIEGTLDKAWAKKLGVDIERLVLIEPEYGEQAIDLAEAVISSKECSILVLDSIAMLTPMKEIEESVETGQMGIASRLITRGIRKLNVALIKQRHKGHVPIFLSINQFRTKIGVMMGDPRTVPGGKAVEYMNTHQVLTYNKEHIIDKGEYAGSVDFNQHEFRITKDKSGGRIRSGAFKLIRDREITGMPEGYIDQAKTVLKYGEDVGLVTAGGGGNYEIEGHGKIRSIESVTEYFMQRVDAFDALQEKIIERFRVRWNIEK